MGNSSKIEILINLIRLELARAIHSSLVYKEGLVMVADEIIKWAIKQSQKADNIELVKKLLKCCVECSKHMLSITDMVDRDVCDRGVELQKQALLESAAAMDNYVTKEEAADVEKMLADNDFPPEIAGLVTEFAATTCSDRIKNLM